MKGRILGLLGLAAFVVALTSANVLAAKAKVNVYGMGPRELTNLGVKLRWEDRWFPSGGSHSVATGTRVWLSGSIDSGTAATFVWTITPPANSHATLDSSSSWRTSFIVDSVGTYVIGLTVNGVATSDTIFGGTYQGVGSITDTDFVSGTATAKQCANCHNSDGPGSVKIPGWATTAHAQRGKWDLTGKIVSHGAPMNDPSCMTCHVTGYNTMSTAGGWYEMWKASGFAMPDSTLKGKMYDTSGAIWHALTGTMKQLSTITCESCHGPYLPAHNSKHPGKTVDASADVCAQCHDKLPNQPNIFQWNSSAHGTLPKTTADNISSASCMQCHSGTGFIKYVKGKADGAAAPVYTADDALQPISCATCHDPHNANNNPRFLRIAKMDTLGNGWAVDFGGKGQLCMNCHRSRRGNAMTYVQTLHKGRMDPHGNPQTDMLAGRNAAYIDSTSAALNEGSNTHKQVADACVTCHMQSSPTNAPNVAGGHTWKMSGKDTSGKSFDQVAACQTCHGTIADFHGVMAARDYDGNGIVQDVQREVKGCLDTLAQSIQMYVNKYAPGLPPALDSVNHPKEDSVYQFDVRIRTAIYNYYFVYNDGSRGIHNAKYAFNILTAAIANLRPDKVVGAVQEPSSTVPSTFALEGNYPNPFNPTTTIKYAIPTTSDVRLTIYDMSGATVKVLEATHLTPGQYHSVWDGTNTQGQTMGSGVYICRLQAGSFSASTKMILMK